MRTVPAASGVGVQVSKKHGVEAETAQPARHRRRKIVVGIGEILWDIIGDQKHLGGAPANFAYHASALGDIGVPVSRVGSDELGSDILASAKVLGICTKYIQMDRRLPTGTATVALDAAGQPRFEITRGVAWDNLRVTERMLGLARRADAVCFGTLAQRNAASRRAIRAFIRAASRALLVCDLNLRAEFAKLPGKRVPASIHPEPDCATRQSSTNEEPAVADIIVEAIRSAHVLKLNDNELCHLRILFGDEGTDDGFLLWLIREFGLRMVCVTRGAQGCILRTARRRVASPGVRVRIVDTVGSGDAFTAALVHHTLRGRSLRETAEFANRVGAYVASQPGAMPPMPPRL